MLFILSVMTTPLNRGRLLCKVARWGADTDSDGLQAAAVIAAMLNSGDERTATASLVSAGNSFRAIAFDRLNEVDFVGSGCKGTRASPETAESVTSAEELMSRTQLVDFGECDAFVSHSWRDPNLPKWEALSEWSTQRQIDKGGKPALLWLDKACVDQTDIKRSLAGLPIFLAGCDNLLVLAGESYTTRLWCVLELFVFLHMGGTRDRLCVVPLASRVGVSKDERALQEAMVMARLRRVDVAQAECYLPEDKERILSVIESSYGTCEAFNAELQRTEDTKIFIEIY